jgi:hypothetical protein
MTLTSYVGFTLSDIVPVLLQSREFFDPSGRTVI